MCNFTKITRVISWLDNARWQSVQVPINNNTFNALDQHEKVLVHWLCYITDLQRPFEYVWEKGGLIFSEIVKEIKDVTDCNNIGNKLWKYRPSDPDSKNSIYPFISKINNNIEYAPNRWAVFYSLLKTLWFTTELKKNGKNLVTFIDEKYNEATNDDERLDSVAKALYEKCYWGSPPNDEINNYDKRCKKVISQWWGTKNNHGNQQIFSSIIDQFDNNENSWDENLWKDRRWHKRLWAGLRDYIKKPLANQETMSTIFKEALPNNSLLKEHLSDDNTYKTLLEQLELPGDTWNNRFGDLVLIGNIDEGVKGKNTKMLTSLLRTLFKQRSELWINGSYPEQFDVSFDFASRMCDTRTVDYKICLELCPFGPKTNDKCQICHRQENKWCSVALATCGYFAKCKRDGCPYSDNEMNLQNGLGVCQEGKRILEKYNSV